MRKLLTLWIALAAIVGISASSFGGSMMLMGAGKPAAAGRGSVTFDAGHAAVTIASGTAMSWTHTPVGTPTGAGRMEQNLQRQPAGQRGLPVT
jgi:hypothetical protein